MKEDPEELAFELDRFAEDFDPYDYADCVDGFDEWRDYMEKTISYLTTGKIKPIIDWFEEYVFIYGDEDEKAMELYERVKACSDESEVKI